MLSDILKKTVISGSDSILNGRNATCTFGAILGAIVLLASAQALAQSTVVIGGSGRSSVEVNLDILAPGSSARAMGMVSATGRILRMPNDHLGETVKLRKPAGMASAPAKSRAQPKSTSPKFVLKPPAMPVIRAKKPRKPKAIAKAKTPAMPKAKVPAVVARPMPKPTSKPMPKTATAAPTQITRAVPAVPKAPVVAAPPPPPPPVAAPVVKAAPVVMPQPVAKAKPAPVKKAPARAAKQVASLPSTASLGKVGLVSRVNFAGASTRLNEDAKNQLRDLATKIAASGERLQLKAFAGGTNGSSSSARRLSLSRALTVRSYLIESGVRSTRIGVRALGRAVDSGPPDRVDLILLAR
jgi:outer membrane protein OmpA-like peptidoglycan-associated protein